MNGLNKKNRVSPLCLRGVVGEEAGVTFSVANLDPRPAELF